MYKIRELVWKDYSDSHSVSEEHSGFFYFISSPNWCKNSLCLTIQKKQEIEGIYQKVLSLKEGKEQAWEHVKARILPALERNQEALNLIKDMHPARVWDIARQYYTSPNKESENWQRILDWHRKGCNEIDKIIND